MLARETRKKSEGFHHQEAFYETLDEKASPESLSRELRRKRPKRIANFIFM
jgi:hypothetical protein